jgi:hypothetical protein
VGIVQTEEETVGQIPALRDEERKASALAKMAPPLLTKMGPPPEALLTRIDPPAEAYRLSWFGTTIWTRRQ